jgi:hypothetical protein
MNASRSIAIAIAGAMALGPDSMTTLAQVTIDLENRYPDVGVIMVPKERKCGPAHFVRQRL